MAWSPLAPASNWVTPAKVLEAIKIIKDGRIYRIGRVHEAAIPKFSARTFNVRTTPVDGVHGTNRLVGHEEFLAGEVAQTGTQPGDLNETRFCNGLEVAKWVIDKGTCLTGGDTWAVEVVPNPDKDLAPPCRPSYAQPVLDARQGRQDARSANNKRRECPWTRDI